MIRKKSSFLSFIFSLLPGAGQMYMGFMKRGVSFMSIFFLLIFMSAWLNLGPLMFIIPIIWFYSFFDVHNLRSVPEEEFHALEDDFILFPEFSKDQARILQSKYRSIFAGVLIIIGSTILWNNLRRLFGWILPSYINDMLYRIGLYFPQLLVGFAIIALGLYLIRGKKKELDNEEKLKMIEEKGGNL